MVGIFSRLSATRAAGLFSLTTPETPGEDANAREPPFLPVADRGVEPVEEFAPIEHPLEPPENDCPVRCPQPEPCIVHDGRFWKERLQLNMKKRSELVSAGENEERRRVISLEQNAPESSMKPSLSQVA